MAITLAKKPVSSGPVAAAPAKPVGVATPMGRVAAPAPAPVAQAEEVAVEVPGGDADGTDVAEPASERKTRADFATHEDFCDYKIAQSQKALERAQAKLKLWQDKKVNKDADVLVKKTKKAEKLLASYAQTLRDMNVPEAAITSALDDFKKRIEAELAAQATA